MSPQNKPYEPQTCLLQHCISILLLNSSFEKNFSCIYFGNRTFSDRKILLVGYFNDNLEQVKKKGYCQPSGIPSLHLFYLNMQAVCPILNHTQPLSLIVDSLILIFMSKSKLKKKNDHNPRSPFFSTLVKLFAETGIIISYVQMFSD